MLTQSESPVAVSGKPSKLVELLRKRQVVGTEQPQDAPAPLGLAPEEPSRGLELTHHLAHVEARGRQPRKPADFAAVSYLTSTNPISKGKCFIPVYPVGPEAPAGARALPPQVVAGWLVATLDARLHVVRGYDEWLPPVRPRDRRTFADRRAHRDLVILLATEIYRRERGAPPPTEYALVGTYLQGLPDDGSAELADGTTPTVE
jgi:hypothetical protein